MTDELEQAKRTAERWHLGQTSASYESALFKRLPRPKILVLDDFAVELATVEQSHLIRRLLDARARHNLSVLVEASNAVEDWGGYFEDPAAAEAIYDRLLGRGKPIVLKHPVA